MNRAHALDRADVAEEEDVIEIAKRVQIAMIIVAGTEMEIAVAIADGLGMNRTMI